MRCMREEFCLSRGWAWVQWNTWAAACEWGLHCGNVVSVRLMHEVVVDESCRSLWSSSSVLALLFSGFVPSTCFPRFVVCSVLLVYAFHPIPYCIAMLTLLLWVGWVIVCCVVGLLVPWGEGNISFPSFLGLEMRRISGLGRLEQDAWRDGGMRRFLKIIGGLTGLLVLTWQALFFPIERKGKQAAAAMESPSRGNKFVSCVMSLYDSVWNFGLWSCWVSPCWAFLRATSEPCVRFISTCGNLCERKPVLPKTNKNSASGWCMSPCSLDYIMCLPRRYTLQPHWQIKRCRGRWTRRLSKWLIMHITNIWGN